MKPERNLQAAKRPSANRDSNLQPVVLCPGLKSRNRRIRTRMYGGVGGVGPRGLPLSRLLWRSSQLKREDTPLTQGARNKRRTFDLRVPARPGHLPARVRNTVTRAATSGPVSTSIVLTNASSAP